MYIAKRLICETSGPIYCFNDGLVSSTFAESILNMLFDCFEPNETIIFFPQEQNISPHPTAMNAGAVRRSDAEHLLQAQ